MPRRDPWFDNAKMVLVTLVVVGHSLVMLPWASTHNQIYDFIYFWHMPAFVLVTGYLSRSWSYSPARVWSLVRGLVVPYLLLEWALTSFRTLVGGEHFSRLWIVPHWPMWYLPAVLCWRLVTPACRRLGLWALPIAVGLSLLGGYVQWDYLDTRRIVGFLPFYVVGLLVAPKTLTLLRTVPARIAAVGVLAGLWVLAGSLSSWAQTRWLYYSWTYNHLHSSFSPVETRALMLGIGLAGTLAVLALIPARGGWFSRMGAASLVVYLCHGFVVKAVGYTAYPDWAAHHLTLSLLTTIAGAIGVALLLASPWVAPRLERLIDPLTYAERRFDHARDLHVEATELEERPRELVGAS